ncbi:hypothetical protein AFERRI_50017 [Acidithiobacillus ferrivorans]|uniref:Uncharacterized protein n=1 Tax=Acidithiobacillus ferrivorans TaxID=160808 RepID=A0A060UR24_9PROT|nr:hypothetical protein AFERRI_50017 [Acidithiobacillus ferrivorans]
MEDLIAIGAYGIKLVIKVSVQGFGDNAWSESRKYASTVIHDG